MLRKLGILIVMIGLVVPLIAGDKPASITGYVRNRSGSPQMGAMVEVLGSAMRVWKAFTDEQGFYTVSGLAPGTYSVRASAPAFLPGLRDRVGLRSGSHATVNLTLSTLFEAIQMSPQRGPAQEDDWKWVLRSVSNRPVLRVLESGSAIVTADGGRDDHDVKATVSFFAGSPSNGYGSTSDMSTGFAVEKSIFSSGTLGFLGNVGYGTGAPSAVLRASYRHRSPSGAEPELSFTMRRLAPPDADLRNATLQAFSLSASDDFTLGNVLELRFGSELQTIQFMGRVGAFRPFGSADLHLSPNTVLEYSYATSEPDPRVEKGFESAPADLSESAPHVSIANFSPELERAHHHELSLSRRMGNTRVQFAAFSDRISDPALTGIGAVSESGGNVLPDLYSESFTYRGRELDARGLRLVLQQKLTSDLTATLDYGYGGVLDLAREGVTLDDARDAMVMRNRHTVAGKLKGRLPCSQTNWIVSYRWMSGEALTPVDLFNSSAGQSDPYLNIYFRQPIPGTGFLPGKMEAMVDVRNLLAQGYIPVLGSDGRTVYLVQSARSVRGGVAFTF
jgi:Carboxypeptidase regulatory-like domain